MLVSSLPLLLNSPLKPVISLTKDSLKLWRNWEIWNPGATLWRTCNLTERHLFLPLLSSHQLVQSISWGVNNSSQSAYGGCLLLLLARPKETLTFWWYFSATPHLLNFPSFKPEWRQKKNIHIKGEERRPGLLLLCSAVSPVQLCDILLPDRSHVYSCYHGDELLSTKSFFTFPFFNRKFAFYNFSLKTALLGNPASLLSLDEQTCFLDLKKLRFFLIVLQLICTWFNFFSLPHHIT